MKIRRRQFLAAAAALAPYQLIGAPAHQPSP